MSNWDWSVYRCIAIEDHVQCDLPRKEGCNNMCTMHNEQYVEEGHMVTIHGNITTKGESSMDEYMALVEDETTLVSKLPAKTQRMLVSEATAVITTSVDDELKGMVTGKLTPKVALAVLRSAVLKGLLARVITTDEPIKEGTMPQFDLTPTMVENTAISVYTNDMDLCGYDFTLVKALAKGLPWTVVEFSRNVDHDEVEKRLALIQPTVAWTDSGTTVAIKIGNRAWMDFPEFDFGPKVTSRVTDDGEEIESFGKFVKRIKTLGRRTYLGFTFSEALANIKVVSYEGDPMDVDGVFYMSHRMWDYMIVTSAERIVDSQARLAFINEMRKCYRTNMRVITSHGLLKGDCIRARNGALPDGVDILVHDVNVKDELSSVDGMIYVVAAPQESSDRVNTDFGTMSNIGQWLWPRSIMKESISNYIETMNDNLLEGRVPSFFFNRRMIDDSVSNTQNRVRVWTEAGLRLEDSFFIASEVAKALANKLDQPSNTDGQLNYPAPKAFRGSITNDTVMHVAGWLPEDVATGKGQIWIDPKTHFVVMSDQDFRENYISHGGYDLDDHVILHFRLSEEGSLVAVVTRQPNQYGEYSVFEVAPNSLIPRGTLWSIDLNDPKRPMHISNQGMEYKGLPSARGNIVEVTPCYTMNHVMQSRIDNEVADRALGMYVNACSMWVNAYRSLPKGLLCSTEDAVDTCRQGGARDDVAAILGAAKGMISRLIQEPCEKVLVDRLTSDPNVIAKMNLFSGRFTRTAEFYRGLVVDFKSVSKMWTEGIRHSHKTNMDELSVKRNVLFAQAYREVEASVRIATGQTGVRGFNTFNEIGNRMGARLSKVDQVRRNAIVMAVRGLDGNDTRLVNGTMLELYMEAVEASKSK